MARDFIINGETLVKVKGAEGAFTNDGPNELGLTVDQVTVVPRWKHLDILADDFGPDIPAELMWNLADVIILMTLIHFDEGVLDRCMAQSMGGAKDDNGVLYAAGIMAGAGRQMGAMKALFDANNHFISLNLLSPVLNRPWRFPKSVLAENPVQYPLGVEKSAVKLVWRAIPYQVVNEDTEVKSAGSILWDRILDTATDVLVPIAGA